ncbi:MAG: alpha/beta fold hydrolase [Candidatus Nanopelagicales bacterium]
MDDWPVNEHIRVALPWVNGHLQTGADRIRRRRIDLAPIASDEPMVVPLADGTDDALAVRVHRPSAGSDGTRPIVLLVHGLGGSIDSPYVRWSALGLLRSGYPVARVDLRGAGASAAHSGSLYHGGRTADLRAVLRALAMQPAAGGVAVMGFSLGGNMALKLLGEPLEGLPVRGGVAVSAPLDLASGTEHLHRMAFGFYERYLMTKMRSDAAHSGLAYTAEERARIARMRTIMQFDDLITAKHNGWRDAAEYYAVNSSAQFLPRITVPTLVIHSIDDPMVPASSYAAIDWDLLSRATPVRRAITRRGGHVGFHEHGIELPWYVRRAVIHFDSLSPRG